MSGLPHFVCDTRTSFASTQFKSSRARQSRRSLPRDAASTSRPWSPIYTCPRPESSHWFVNHKYRRYNSIRSYPLGGPQTPQSKQAALHWLTGPPSPRHNSTHSRPRQTQDSLPRSSASTLRPWSPNSRLPLSRFHVNSVVTNRSQVNTHTPTLWFVNRKPRRSQPRLSTRQP